MHYIYKHRDIMRYTDYYSAEEEGSEENQSTELEEGVIRFKPFEMKCLKVVIG